MQSLVTTKTLLDTYVQRVMELKDWFWDGVSNVSIENVDTAQTSIRLVDGRTMHINKATELMKTKVQLLERAQQQKITELREALSKLVKIAYDYNGALVVIPALRAEGYNNALARKPKRALHSVYANQAPVTTKIQLAFNTAVNSTRFTPTEYTEFKVAYLEGFEQGLTDKVAVKQAKQRADRRCVDAVINSYPGDVDELIDWLKEYATGVYIKAAREEEFFESPTSEKCRVKALESLEATIDELMYEDKVLDTFELERNTGMFNCWEIRLKAGHKESAPEAVHEWLYDKKVPGDIDTYELGTVYKSKLNKINSNPIVKDLVFNYGFKLGKY